MLLFCRQLERVAQVQDLHDRIEVRERRRHAGDARATRATASTTTPAECRAAHGIDRVARDRVRP